MRSELERLFRWLKDRRHHRRGYRRARRRDAHAQWARGVRLGLRDLARPPREGSGHHAPGTYRQVSRLDPRHERVPVLDRPPGISVLPITGLGLDYPVHGRVSTGIPALDQMWPAGATIAAAACWCRARPVPARAAWWRHYVAAACARGERCLYFALEEPSAQVVRNMGSIGISCGALSRRGQLRSWPRAPRCLASNSTWRA